MSRQGDQPGHPRFYELLDRMRAIHDAKNRDYTGDRDPLDNLRECEAIGVKASRGAFVRMCDKWSRLKALLDGRTPNVKDETVVDTLLDLANYSLLTAILWEQEHAPTPAEPLQQPRATGLPAQQFWTCLVCHEVSRVGEDGVPTNNVCRKCGGRSDDPDEGDGCCKRCGEEIVGRVLFDANNDVVCSGCVSMEAVEQLHATGLPVEQFWSCRFCGEVGRVGTEGPPKDEVCKDCLRLVSFDPKDHAAVAERLGACRRCGDPNPKGFAIDADNQAVCMDCAVKSKEMGNECSTG